MKSVLPVICLFAFPCLLFSADNKAENILLHQREIGGWPKNYDRNRELTEGDKKKLQGKKSDRDTTFDNGATHTEIRYLAEAFLKAREKRYREAALKGVDFMLAAQYANGGWPQSHPKPSGYSAHVTFNDGAMIGVMSVLRDISGGRNTYPFVSDELRNRCSQAVARGIPCILKCQIIVEGKKTAWCAQHDENNLVPRGPAVTNCPPSAEPNRSAWFAF